jgi:hypothetical protein
MHFFWRVILAICIANSACVCGTSKFSFSNRSCICKFMHRRRGERRANLHNLSALSPYALCLLLRMPAACWRQMRHARYSAVREAFYVCIPLCVICWREIPNSFSLLQNTCPFGLTMVYFQTKNVFLKARGLLQPVPRTFLLNSLNHNHHCVVGRLESKPYRKRQNLQTDPDQTHEKPVGLPARSHSRQPDVCCFLLFVAARCALRKTQTAGEATARFAFVSLCFPILKGCLFSLFLLSAGLG